MDKNRLIASLERKINQSVGHRADMQLSDTRKINKTTAHFMIGYLSDNPPNSEDLSEFFVRKFDAKITPFLSTSRVYEREKVVTVVAQILNVTRELDDIKRRKMTPVIEGAVYLDVPLEETWEVEEKNGKKVLVRKVKDDIIALVQARKQAMLDQSSVRQTFASVVKGDNILRYLALLDKGDRIKVLLDEKIVDAEVVSVTNGNLRVKHKGGTTTVPRHMVVDVTSRAADKEAATDKMLEDYFTEAYGYPEYAKDLVKGK